MVHNPLTYTLFVVRQFLFLMYFFFQAEDGIRDYKVTGVQTCALPISSQPPCTIHRFVASCRSYPHLIFRDAIHGQRYLVVGRSEERRVGKEWRSRRWAFHEEENIQYRCWSWWA